MTTIRQTLRLTLGEEQAVQKVWQFSRILCAAGVLDYEQLGDYMDKPWKWQQEFDIWHCRGCPDLDGDAGAFDAFAEVLRRLFDDTEDGAL